VGLFGHSKHSFVAEITILPLGPKTRNTHPFNGVRWDFCYPEEVDESGRATQVSMTWPEFVDEHDQTISTDIPLQGRLRALMHISTAEMVEYHRKKLEVGTRFMCTEGSRIVAHGLVVSTLPMK